MAEWTLAAHGDSLERRWGRSVLARAPLYEVFWATHVVPLTYRMADPSCIYLRSVVRKELENLATWNYAIFTHLAACHEQLEASGESLTAATIYNFYSRLYSAGGAVRRFLAAVRTVLVKYQGEVFDRKDYEARFAARGALDLATRFTEAFETRTKDYRGQQVHHWGFPVIDHRIPRREHLGKWIGKGLGELDSFLKLPDGENRLGAEFVDAREQASADLGFVEHVVNNVWAITLKELEEIKERDRYHADQLVGSKSLPPTRQPIVGSASITFRLRRSQLGDG